MSHLSSYLNYILRMLRIIFFFFLFHFDSYVAFVSSVMIIYTYEKFEFMFRLAFYRTQQGKNKIRDCYHTPVCILYVDVHKIYTNILCQVFVSAYIHTYIQKRKAYWRDFMMKYTFRLEERWTGVDIISVHNQYSAACLSDMIDNLNTYMEHMLFSCRFVPRLPNNKVFSELFFHWRWVIIFFRESVFTIRHVYTMGIHYVSY